MSETDRLDYMKSKMDEWMKNGCRLGWLIDPSEEQVSIYRAGAEVEAVEGFDQVLSGEPVLSGFEFSLAELRRT